MAEEAGTAPEVDENGEPETPVKQALDKKKKKNLLYAGLALGALAIVVAIYLARRNAAAQQAAASSATLPNTSGTLAGADPGNSTNADAFTQLGLGISNLSGQEAALQGQLASQQAASLKAQAGLQAAINRLTAELKATQSGGNHTKPPPGTGVGKTPARPVAKPKKKVLPKVNAAAFPNAFPEFAPNAPGVTVLGVVGQPGLRNVSGGAPVYGLVNGPYGPVWEQGAAATKPGDKVATLSRFKQYIVG